MKSTIAISLICASFVVIAGDKSKDREDGKSQYSERQLQRWLKKFPEADANQDGRLTTEEAIAYRKKLKGGGGSQQSKAKGGAKRSKAKANSGNVEQPTEANVKYGPHERNVLDFYQAESPEPTPALIYFHGGGFTGGAKRYTGTMKQCRDKGMSVIAANYRLTKPQGITVEHSMLDGARVVQFVRSKAKEWNIDPDKIVLTGGSAGACLSMWVATADDLADPDSDDPVARQSTRVKGVWALSGQTSVDPVFISENISGKVKNYGGIPYLYDVQDFEAFKNDPEARRMAQTYSSINQVTKDDPPLLMTYKKAPPQGLHPENANLNDIIHSPIFGVLMKKKYDDLGLDCQVVFPGNPGEEDGVTFLFRCVE